MKESPVVDPSPLITVDLGVWRVTMAKEPRFNIRKRAKDFLSALPLIKTLATDIFKLEPTLFILFLISQAWSGIETAILLYLSSRFLRIIEIGLTERAPDVTAILQAGAARLICVLIVAVVEWQNDRIRPVLRTRVQAHFQIYLMQAKLRVDLSALHEPETTTRVNSRDAWQAFEGIVSFCTDLLRTGSQLTLIAQSSRANNNPLFSVMCVAKPLISVFGRQTLWYRAHISNTINEQYDRTQALDRLSTQKYRADVISGNLEDYIVQQYQKATDLLGGVSDEWPESQYGKRSTPAWGVLSGVLGDLPMMYCALVAILYPSTFSVSSIAILQQSSATLRYSLTNVLQNADSFRRQLNDIRNLYNATNASSGLANGQKPYPDPSSESKGMSFDLRNVSFAYPGSKATANALNNVTLSIKSGQLIVIVGSNGSGKSTIVKLLSRLYDPISGEIMVDSNPLTQYRLSDIRQATATLTQDHHMFPLSLAENIGLGHPECVNDKEMVAKAAESGGATHCLSKLVDGAETILEPMSRAYGSNLVEDPNHPLQAELKKLRKSIEISGGETQRMVASRTFMRFFSGKVKFVAVDEPSSALDPEGEAQLFDNLRKAQEGKTMVFVTHRFGHLTRYADQIICMKEGSVAETGTHEELLALDGEYAKLYNIQARAFVGEKAKVAE